MRAPLRNLRQPWLFIYFALGFAALNLLISRSSIPFAVASGLLFATLMSIWTERRRRRIVKASAKRSGDR